MIRVLILMVIGVVAFWSYVRYLEKVTAFRPERELMMTPEVMGLDFEDVYLTVKGLKVHGWWVPKEGVQRTLFYLHGNAGNIADRVEKIKAYHDLGFNFFIIDYRGYGQSEGSPSETNLYEDARAGYDYLIEEKGLNADDIILCGGSLGGAVAVDLAAKVPTRAVILDSTFSSGVDVGRSIYPYIPAFMISYKFDSMAKIADVKVPKIFIHSQTDPVIPIKFGMKLYKAAPGPKEFVRMKGDHVVSHRDDKERFEKSIQLFIEGLE